MALDLLAERPDRHRPASRSSCSASRRAAGPWDRLDLPGLVLAGIGLLGIVWGLVRGNALGWSSPAILGAILGGLVVMGLFVAWELRAPAPMLPMRFFRNRAFALANLASLFFSFGMFGSIFLLAQFFQTVQGYSPLASGLRILPWTAMPMLVAPIAGAMSDRDRRPPADGRGAGAAGDRARLDRRDLDADAALRRHRAAVHRLRDRDGAVLRAGRERRALVGRSPVEQGQASGANNAIRELGGVLGVAVLASVFAHVRRLHARPTRS